MGSDCTERNTRSRRQTFPFEEGQSCDATPLQRGITLNNRTQAAPSASSGRPERGRYKCQKSLTRSEGEGPGTTREHQTSLFAPQGQALCPRRHDALNYSLGKFTFLRKMRRRTSCAPTQGVLPAPILSPSIESPRATLNRSQRDEIWCFAQKRNVTTTHVPCCKSR